MTGRPGAAAAPEPEDDPSHRLDIATARFQLQNVGASVLPAFAIAALLFLALHNDANRRWLVAWAGALVLVKLAAAWHARRALRSRTRPEDVRRITVTQTSLYALQGGLWGGLAWISVHPEALVDSFVVTVAAAGLSSASVPYLAANLSVFVAFVVTIFAGVASRLLVIDDPSFHLLAVMAAAVPASLFTQARSSARSTRESLAIRFANDDLVRQLRVESENARRAYEAARQANEAKLRFLAAASHDLRQPVHALGLFLEALGRSGLDEDQADMLATAQAVTATSVSMLNALLDYSRVEASAIEPVLQPVALQRLLNKMEIEYGPLADQKGLVYRSRDTSAIVHSDPMVVELILRNLIGNAIRYTHKGGVLVAARRRGGQVIVEVWDTGIGIPADQYDAIFDEFTQLHNPERDQRRGLGLGLAITRGLARLLDIEIGVSSVVGSGSVFRFSLPITAADPAPDPDRDVPDTRALPRRTRILVVDDDASVREAMLATIRGWGCVGEAVESLGEAVTAARRQRPDVVVSDFRLRGACSGIEVITALRSECGARLPALLISGDTAPDAVKEAMRIGVRLLHKPVSAESLLQAVAQTLAAERADLPDATR
ncbi:MAG: hybrid sensor histidine kinase/response regulator [Lautropia sp.]